MIANLVSPTGAYNVQTTDDVIRASGTFAVNLPAATGTGKVYHIKNIGVGTITVTPNGSDKIDGDSSKTLSQYTSIMLVDGAAAAWDIL
jgi:hypothetical protein